MVSDSAIVLAIAYCLTYLTIYKVRDMQHWGALLFLALSFASLSLNLDSNGGPFVLIGLTFILTIIHFDRKFIHMARS